MLLKNAIVEKDVENIYRGELSKCLDQASITSPFKCDGYLQLDKLGLLMEFKLEENLKDRLSLCSVLIQLIYYLKKFELSGEKLPTILLGADKNEYFILHTNSVIDYLSWEIDWALPPSQAHQNNHKLLDHLMSNENINPFIHNISDQFNIKEMVDEILATNNDQYRKIRITKHNLTAAFDRFIPIVKNKMKVNDAANLFVQILINPRDNYLHPQKRNILVTKGFGEVRVDSRQYGSYFKYFEDVEYSPREKDELTTLVDRLIEDVTRRRQGEFFTPTVWVDEAHRMLSEAFGEDWKERFIVWDCAAGTLNLTRDYRFKELYCSTLNESDLETARQRGYNPEATLFQFDFLNDPIEKAPEGLQKAIAEGREILFLINPPYGTAGEIRKDTESKTGIAESTVNKRMSTAGWGASSQQLYAQFFFRIHELSQGNVFIGVYAKSLYKTGPSYKAFREKFYTKFEYVDGMLFNAAHFDGTSDSWGVDFSIWKPGVEARDSLELTVKDAIVDGVICISKKSIYNCDSSLITSDWVRESIKKYTSEDAPQMTSALALRLDNKDLRGKLIKNSLGFFMNGANNIIENGTGVALFSSCAARGNGLSVLPENYERAMTLFAARKLIKGNWINDKDEYLAPDETHPEFKQFTLDSIVYSLFNNSSQQSSLRGIEYKGQKWDIKNEFFWLPKSLMIELATTSGFGELYEDARTDEDRFVYKKLEVYGEPYRGKLLDFLSPDARHVLDLATELVKKSITMRAIVHDEHPEYHLNAWDAGYAQLKLVWKKYFPKEFKELREAYARLEERMQPLVYELGFLKK